MKSFLFGAAAVAVFFSAWCPALKAQVAADHPVAAHTVVCDTPDQIRSVLEKGANEAAAAAVNAETGLEDACAAGEWVFVPGEDIGEASGWTIARVLVIGFLRGGQMVRVHPMEQFTAHKPPGRDV